MSRSSCLDCCRKHLAQALVLMLEVPQGYPLHGWIAVGHMGEAADEMIENYYALAERIRDERIKYMIGLNSAIDIDEDEIISVNAEKLYDVPILEMILDITKQSLIEEVYINDS